VGKKQDLLKVAVQLFSKQGSDGTTTREIAEAAHATDPVVYTISKIKTVFSPISFDV